MFTFMLVILDVRMSVDYTYIIYLIIYLNRYFDCHMPRITIII